MENKQKKETFSSSIAVFFATLASTIGIGNIWKFPYLTGANGGAAFVIIYLGCVVLLGIPLMLGEFYVGRKSRKNPVGAFKALSNNKFWNILGYGGVITATIIMFFYSTITSWIYVYLFKALKGGFAFLGTLSTSEAVEAAKVQYDSVINSPTEPIIAQLIILGLIAIVLIAGIKNGIEKFTTYVMPVLFIIILICDIKAFFMPGASEGLKFLFLPDFSKVTSATFLTALGLAFFKLALAMGVLIAYSSYFTDDTNLIKNSVKVSLSDTAISLLAGVAIFPIVFSFNLEPSAGAGLLFQSIPLAFSRMPLGNILLFLFFLLTAIAATCAQIALVEVPVSFLSGELKIKRSKAVIIVCSFIFIIAVLTTHPTSLFGWVSIGGRNLLDFYDFLTSSIVMPILGILTCIFIGFFVKKEDFIQELTNNGSLKYADFIKIILVLLKFVVPTLISIIFLSSLNIL